MPDSGRWTPGGGDPSLNEINLADRFFEALAAKQPVYSTDREEAELAYLFSGFRDDVRDAPVTVPVSTSDAVEALRDGLAGRRGSRRGFAIVGSVAAAVLCVGGFGTAVYGAGPGDSLYGMRTALFGQQEQTRDDQVSLASAQLQQVQQLIDEGQWQQAQDKLVQLSPAVQGVDRVESKQQLVEQWNALTYKVVEQDPAATLPPGEPLPVLPSSPLTWLPVPVVQAPTSDTSATSVTSVPSMTSDTSGTSATTVPTEASTPAPESSTSALPTSDTPSTSTATSTATPSAPPPSTTASSTSSAPTPTTPTSAPGRTTTTTTSTPAPTSTSTEPPQTSSSVASSEPAPSRAPERPSEAPTTTVVPRSGGVS